MLALDCFNDGCVPLPDNIVYQARSMQRKVADAVSTYL
jgi:hypothetical protein